MNKKTFTPTAILVSALAAGVLGTGLAILVMGPDPTSSAKGPGSVYDTPVPVADFTLTDQTNKPFTFSSTKGKVVLLSFLYTHCGDVCPFSALKMRQAAEILKARGSEIELVAISTDPERDTVPVVASYSQELGLYDRWHFLTGDVGDLQQVYKSLKISVVRAEADDVAESVKQASELGVKVPARGQAGSPLEGLTDEQVQVGSDVARKYSGGYEIAHSAPFWVVDREGRVRISLDVEATPGQLAEAIQAYLN